MMQTIIVAAIVAAAVSFVIWKIAKSLSKKDGCGCCANCPNCKLRDEMMRSKHLKQKSKEKD